MNFTDLNKPEDQDFKEAQVRRVSSTAIRLQTKAGSQKYEVTIDCAPDLSNKVGLGDAKLPSMYEGSNMVYSRCIIARNSNGNVVMRVPFVEGGQKKILSTHINNSIIDGLI